MKRKEKVVKRGCEGMRESLSNRKQLRAGLWRGEVFIRPIAGCILFVSRTFQPPSTPFAPAPLATWMVDACLSRLPQACLRFEHARASRRIVDNLRPFTRTVHKHLQEAVRHHCPSTELFSHNLYRIF